MTSTNNKEQELIPDYDKWVWIASWEGHKATIKGIKKATPGWISEGGSSVRWKAIETPMKANPVLALPKEELK